MYKSQVLYLKEEEKMHPETVAGSQTNMTMKFNAEKKWGSMIQSSRNLVCANLHEKQETAKIRAKFKENNLHTNKRCTIHFMSLCQ